MCSLLLIQRYCYQGGGHRRVRAAVQGKYQWEMLGGEEKEGRRGGGHHRPPLAGADLTWLDAAVVGGGGVQPSREQGWTVGV